MPFEPSSNPTLLNLKRIAERGGERGPRFDKGILSVIEAVLKDGQFVRSRMVGLSVLSMAQRNLTVKLITADEETELRNFIASRGWSPEEANEFLSGVDLAERCLHIYEVRSEPDAD
jgi:hypothetical protein